MRRSRKNSIKRERIIMITSSAFVLAALTMTGIYMREQNEQEKDDGYVVDFTAYEDTPDEALKGLAQQESADGAEGDGAGLQADAGDQEGGVGLQADAGSGDDGTGLTAGTGGDGHPVSLEDDLDYMPMEAGSSLVEIPGLTDGITEADTDAGQNTGEEETPEQEAAEQTAAEHPVVLKTLDFDESQGLLRPTTGEVLLPYSMDSSIYFATLDQYKYNPAVMISAPEGTVVSACAEGKVVRIFENEEIGNAVTLDLGDGYQVTYGQLKEITVQQDSYVNEGETLGVVAAPTKYYSVEGSNVYFQLTKDGEPVNPESMFR